MVDVVIHNRPSSSALLRNAVVRSVRRFVASRNFGLTLAIGIILIYLAFRVPAYFRASNLQVLGLQLAFIGLPAVSMTLLMISGYVDLSIGSVLSLLSVLGTQFALQFGFGIALLLVVAIAAAIGLVNGYLVWRLSISPLIVTLAGLTFYQGVIDLITSGNGATDLAKGFTKYGQGGAVFGIPNLVVLLFVVALISGFHLHKTSGGLNIFAIGGSRRAALLAGIKVRRLVLGLFCVNMVIVGVTALLESSQFGGATPIQGTGLELSVITAVVLGGVSFAGGEGSVIGTLLACALLTVVSSGIVALNINAFWSEIVSGLLLVGAVSIDQITEEQRDRYRRLVAMRAAMDVTDAGD